MNDIAIQVEKIGKKYPLTPPARYMTLRDRLAFGPRLIEMMTKRPSPPGRKKDGFFWALRDIDFELQHGEILGIIGHNGAGKSTLLKILSRITRPTTGRAAIHGRVGSLLEVGTGFHPELTGRENIFLNGAILGMKKREIEKKFAEIVAFAETARFIDTPVKYYSSGMYMRLAFAVAAHLETEILMIDEVLAVGDVQFQKKCLGKMGDIARIGRTVLFVSHNMPAISTLTKKCLVLSHGKCIFQGPTAEAVRMYLELHAGNPGRYTALPAADRPAITRVEVLTSEPNSVQAHGKPMEIEIDISTPIALKSAALSFQVLNALQQPVMYTWMFDSVHPLCRTPGVHRVRCRLPKVRLYLGHYTLTVNFSEQFGKSFSGKLENICPFSVEMLGIAHDFSWSPDYGQFIDDYEWESGPA
ncbi:MAG TPA: ABC transporter ATP-binding protein [Acidobacteriota bacterium]